MLYKVGDVIVHVVAGILFVLGLLLFSIGKIIKVIGLLLLLDTDEASHEMKNFFDKYTQ